MACKTCKEKKLRNSVERIQKNLMSHTDSFDKQVYDKTLGQQTKGERIILIFGAFIPLIIGYVTIIRFVISFL
jgi:hypothetical protein|tara:strand:+ start:84 stop:302 length:219 start_codon:yes stop_codon:yes gene_type:complete